MVGLRTVLPAAVAFWAATAATGCLLESHGLLTDAGSDATGDGDTAPACDDLRQNGAETDVDCGGGTCPACPDGGGCDDGDDCVSGVCADGICVASHCDDGVVSGDESSIDCGGSCDPCPTGSGCRDGSDCESGVCDGGFCAAPACDDGVHNGGESDVDCGGTCPPCAVGRDCSRATDCATLLCDRGLCRDARSCYDLALHAVGLPTKTYTVVPVAGAPAVTVRCDMDTDGGGWTLVASTLGVALNDERSDWHEDLLTISPVMGHSGVWDGLRDVMTDRSDLRFSCRIDPAVAAFDVDLSFYGTDWYREITTGTDGESCFNEWEGAGFELPAPARRNILTDELLRRGDYHGFVGYLEGEDLCDHDGDFTVDFDDRGMDSDQGDGTDWGEDDTLLKCGINDVATGVWLIWAREADLSCSDGEVSGDESDVDCGGTCPPCAAGARCLSFGECESGVCTDGMCQPPTCSDLRRNGDETAVDCGGDVCPPCGVGRACVDGDDCAAPARCNGGRCRAPTGTDCFSSACPSAQICEFLSCRYPRSCLELHRNEPALPDGVYTLHPTSAAVAEVYCDMTTDDGGWTLVASSAGEPLNDRVGGWHEDLMTLTPAAAHASVWPGLRTTVGTDSGIRFSCKVDAYDPAMAVDLSFYNNMWHWTITSGRDVDSCFSVDRGYPYEVPPARRDNLSGATRRFGDTWNAGYLAGEASCDDWNNFTVDFDDRGMNGNEADGTDWGEDDGLPKCGSTITDHGAFFIWVR